MTQRIIYLNNRIVALLCSCIFYLRIWQKSSTFVPKTSFYAGDCFALYLGALPMGGI